LEGSQFIIHVENEEPTVVDTDISFETEINNIIIDDNIIDDNIDSDNRNDITKFIEIMDSIYMDFSARINVNTWIELLNHDVVWNLENRIELFIKVIRFLSQHRNLPKEVWELLDETFQLQKQMNNPIFSEYYTLRNFLVKVFSQKSMTFDYLVNMEYEDRERYIELRIYALDSLRRKCYGEAYEYIEEAKSIFDGDPELLYLEGRYLYIFTKIDEAIDVFSRVLQLMPGYQEVLKSRADAYMRIDDFINAKTDIEKLIELKPSDDLIIYLAKIHIKLGQPVEARNLFKKINAYNGIPNDSIFRELLETNNSILKRSKEFCRNGNLHKSEIPLIKAELKRLREYEKDLIINSEDVIDKIFIKTIIWLVLFMLSILIAGILTGISSRDKSNAEVDKTGLDKTVEMLSSPGIKTIVKINDLVVPNTFILKNTNGEMSGERLLTLEELINVEDPLKRADVLLIGKAGKDYLLIRGSFKFYLELVKNGQKLAKELPSEITIEGKIAENHLTDLISKMRDKISNDKYDKYLNTVDSKYIFHADKLIEAKKPQKRTGLPVGIITLLVVMVVLAGGYIFCKSE